MSTLLEAPMVAIITAAVVLPFAVYLSVKLGTYAFFRGRQIFYQEESHKEEHDERP